MSFRNLRILLVGPLPPPAGGMANQTRQLAELLRGEGAEVEIVQVNAPYQPAWVAGFKGVRAVARIVPYLFRLWRGAGPADLIHVMANSGWSWHLFAAPAVWVGVLRRTPVVVNYRGGEADAFLRRAAGWVRPTLQRAALLVLPSGFLLDVFGRHGMPGRVVANIIDLKRFHPAEPRAEEGGAAPHIVVARNLETIYGIDVALEAFARIVAAMPAARLSVAGSGPLDAALKAQAARLGIAHQIDFTGRLDRDQMAALYRAADLTLNPSRVDNMPNSVLEALASGVPVVTTHVGGIPYLVEDERTALLVPPDDPNAMAAAALRILTDRALAGRLRAAGLVEAARYSWDAVRNDWLSAYQQALPRTGQLSGGNAQEGSGS